VLQKRLRLLEALARAQEAQAEAMRLAIELGEHESESGPARIASPPNVVREAEKTGPRLPFKAPPPTSPLHSQLRSKVERSPAFTQGAALRHVRRCYEEATTDDVRLRVIRIMRKLVAQGLLVEQDVAHYLALEPRLSRQGDPP